MGLGTGVENRGEISDFSPPPLGIKIMVGAGEMFPVQSRIQPHVHFNWRAPLRNLGDQKFKSPVDKVLQHLYKPFIDNGSC